jgi:hypothetical protein
LGTAEEGREEKSISEGGKKEKRGGFSMKGGGRIGGFITFWFFCLYDSLFY